MIEQQFIEYVVKQLVDRPEAVAVERIIDERGILLKLTVAPEDLGRVIGKHGATAQSLRNLLRALGTKNNDHYNLKIVDVDKPEEEREESGQSREDVSQDDAEAREVGETTPESPASVETVEKSTAGTVDNIDAERKKIRESLADLDDLDI